MFSTDEKAATLRQIARRLRGQDLTPEYTEAQTDLGDLLPRKRTYSSRRVGLDTMARYILATTRELLGEPMRVMEFGPGCGYWMEFARALGHTVEGVDIVPTAAVAECFEVMTNGLDLGVRYVGVGALIAERNAGRLGDMLGAFHLVHTRGMLDAFVGLYTADVQRARLDALMETVTDLLRPGGVWVVAHNRDSRMETIQGWMEESTILRFERVSEQVTRHWKD